jgi:hypothetical protein
MRLPTDIESLSMAVAYAAFWLIVATLAVTWCVQVLLRPQTRMEWAEFGKITAFLAIVLRTAWTLQTGRILSAHVAVVFWVVCFFLILNYLVAMLDGWGPPFVRVVFGSGVSRWTWLVPAVVLLIVVAIIYHVIIG